MLQCPDCSTCTALSIWKKEEEKSQCENIRNTFTREIAYASINSICLSLCVCVCRFTLQCSTLNSGRRVEKELEIERALWTGQITWIYRIWLKNRIVNYFVHLPLRERAEISLALIVRKRKRYAAHGRIAGDGGVGAINALMRPC